MGNDDNKEVPVEEPKPTENVVNNSEKDTPGPVPPAPVVSSVEPTIAPSSQDKDTKPAVVPPVTNVVPEEEQVKSTNGAVIPPGGAQKRKRSRGQKSKKKRKREEGEPKHPLTGYVLYMNERRDALRVEFPEKTANEHTKIIADEWNHMNHKTKKSYLQAAKVDKERYIQEMSEFNKKKYLQQQKEQAALDGNASNTTGVINTVNATVGTGGPGNNVKQVGNHNEKFQNATGKENSVSKNSHTNAAEPKNMKIPRRGLENGIPIFTEEFLEHNKTVDSELRTLRKSNSDYEQQNSVLEKHIENMKFGVEKVENENNELMDKNRLLESYIEKFRQKLANALSGLAIPNQPNGATLDNINDYMNDLYSMATSNSHGPASLNKAKDIIRKLDLQIQP